jgi:hypothetical protein
MKLVEEHKVYMLNIYCDGVYFKQWRYLHTENAR